MNSYFKVEKSKADDTLKIQIQQERSRAMLLNAQYAALSDLWKRKKQKKLSKYELVKQQLSMLSVIGRYGFEPNRSGFISCPFHSEKTASMKIYDKSFYCFGCGKGGDVIKFVSLLFNISAPQAVVKLNSDFFLGLKTGVTYDRQAEKEYALKKLRKEQELKALRQEYMSKCDEFKCLRSVPKPIAGEDFSGYAQAQARLEYLDYWFSVNHWR